MAIQLYDATVANFLQTLAAASGFLEKGLAHCVENKIDPAQIVDARLHPDMLPFRFQIVSVAHHSIGAIDGVKAGVFSPSDKGPADYAGLQKMLTDAAQALRLLSREDINALEGRDMVFQLGERKLPFVAESFLLSFSLPNFYFHATTAYGILRHKGVPLGKRNFLGQMRMKT